MHERRGAVLALLAVLAAGYTFFLLRGGAAVQLQPDDGYEAASRFTRLDNMLSYHRTFAYPLVLRAVRVVSPSYDALPHLQALMFLSAVAFLFSAQVRVGMAPWTAFFASAPLVANPLLYEHAAFLLTDTLGAALALLAVASFLLVRATSGLMAYFGVTVFTFLAYQTRPALLFLVVLLPVVAVLLPGRRLVHLLRLAACCVVPLLLFCSFRWSINGQFGLVSFGGYSAIGVAGSLLSPETIAGLSPDLRPLAESLYHGRLAVGHTPIQDRDFPTARARYDAWFSEVNSNVWRVAARPAFEAARQRYRALFPQPTPTANAPALSAEAKDEHRQAFLRWRADGRRWSRLEANRLLARLSREIVLQHEGLFAQWIVQGLRHAAARAVAVVPVLGISLVALLLAGGWFTVLQRRGGVGTAALRETLRRSSAALAPLVLTALSVAVASVLTVVLIHRPLDRYLAAAVLLLPGTFAACAWELGRIGLLDSRRCKP